MNNFKARGQKKAGKLQTILKSKIKHNKKIINLVICQKTENKSFVFFSQNQRILKKSVPFFPKIRKEFSGH